MGESANAFRDRIAGLSPKRLALLAVALQERLERSEAQHREPIAVIGMACRFPGAATPEAFWHVMESGMDAVREVPADRWRIDDYYDPDPSAPGKMSTRWGGFLERIDGFDAPFFGIAPREAATMDPQQRLLMEVTWEAIENAGHSPPSLAGSATGVFVGICGSDYFQLQMKSDGPAVIDAYLATGVSHSVASGRLSYFLGLTGPSLSIDTACSSSLVAVHLACQSLRARECSMALAGGVSLMMLPEATVTLSKAQMMAPDGRCKTFDAAANGFVRAEGCGMIALKRLSDAVSDGDNISAVIVGTACNQDGRSNGLTAPNGPAQEAVIRQALERAGLEAEAVGYVEAHGTGTALGDPIEVQALGNVLCAGRPKERPLVIGSVKTNVGHLEAAAGIAGLIKAALCIERREIPAHLHFGTPSPHIPWERYALKVPTHRQAWEQERRVAGVSSFGFSGTNAHVIVSAAPEEGREGNGGPGPGGSQLLVLSAKEAGALREMAGRYAAHLEGHRQERLADVCYTAAVGRGHFGHRLAVCGADVGEVAAGLGRHAKGEEGVAGIQSAAVEGGEARRAALIFTGQGSQYAGMGGGLYEREPVFRQALERCAKILEGQLERPLLEVLYGGAEKAAGLLDQTAYTQPGLFALEYALGELWRSWGVRPGAVLGHSVGEYVAATMAGVFSLEDGLRLIGARGRLMQGLPAGGTMAAVFGTEAEVRGALRGLEGEVGIAALNGPKNTVISGAAGAMEEVLGRLGQQRLKARKLVVSHAFHSRLMEPMLEGFAAVAGEVKYHRPKLPLVSNVTGRLVEGEEVSQARYWCEHVCAPVRFAQGLEALVEHGWRTYLEVGPHPVLTGMARQCVEGTTGLGWISSLQRGQEDTRQMQQALGGLYVRGINPDWNAVYGQRRHRRLRLPAYPFQRQRHWVSTPAPMGSIEGWRLERTGEDPRASRAAQPGMEDCLYEVRWLPIPKSLPAGSPVETGSWLIVTEQEEAAEPWCAALKARGQRMQVACAPAPSSDVESMAQAYQAILRAARAQIGPLIGITHLVGTEGPALSLEADVATLETSVHRSCVSALSLLRAVVNEGPENSARLWLVTRDGLPMTASRPSAVEQSPMWGLGRTMAMEHPEVWGGIMDIAGATAPAVRVAVDQMLCPRGEDQIAISGEDVHAGRLIRSPRIEGAIPDGPIFRANACYLVTGGFGGIGRTVLDWMADQGARHIVVIGRSIDPSNPDKAVATLAARGVEVVSMRADVADDPALGRVFDAIQTTMPSLAGVLHMAGIVDDRVLSRHDWPRFERVLKPKVAGGWNLHRRTREMPLDFFVLFSSAASFLAPVGLGNYAAGNTFLDALAHHRRALGLPAVSINWGPWENLGMAQAVGDRRRNQWNQAGFSATPAERNLAILGQLVRAAPPQVGVLWVDWQTYLGRFAAKESPALYALLAPVRDMAVSTPTGKNLPVALAAAANSQERRTLLRNHLRHRIARVLGFSGPEAVDVDLDFFQMGMDSLTALELKNGLQADLQQVQPATLIFDHPSVTRLTEFLAEGAASPDRSGAAAATPREMDYEEGSL